MLRVMHSPPGAKHVEVLATTDDGPALILRISPEEAFELASCLEIEGHYIEAMGDDDEAMESRPKAPPAPPCAN